MANEAETVQPSKESHRILRVAFYAGITIASLGGLGLFLAFFAGLGTPWISYTVVNETDTPLISWVLDHPCEDLVGMRGDYSHVEAVPAHGAVKYDESSRDDKCIQIATVDRRLVLSRQYEDEAIVVVREPLEFLTAPLPIESDLEAHPWWRFFTSPNRRLLVVYMSLPFIAVGGLVTSWTHRWLRRYGIRV